MLTYALVDRGTVAINGLDQQTGDKAWLRGRYLFGQAARISRAGDPALCVHQMGVPPAAHPLGTDPRIHILAGGLLGHAGNLGPAHRLDRGAAGDPGPRPGLLARRRRAGRPGLRPLDAGVCLRNARLRPPGFGLRPPGLVLADPEDPRVASACGWPWPASSRRSASVIELQVAPVSAILGLYLLAEVLRRRYRPGGSGMFALGAAIPTLAMLAYNQVAFGSPWDMGYFHHVDFAHVHTRGNPLGLRPPDWGKLGPLLWGRYRGLFFYAPILILAVPGWVVLMLRPSMEPGDRPARWLCRGPARQPLYPEWTGGWSTGPRLLLPLIPFAMIPVAGLLAGRGPMGQAFTWIASRSRPRRRRRDATLPGGRSPHPERGRGRGPRPRLADRAARRSRLAHLDGSRTVSRLAISGSGSARISSLSLRRHSSRSSGRRWKPLQFLPLVVAQILAMTILRRYARLVDDPHRVRLDAGGSMDRSRNRNPDPDPELHLDASSSTGSPSQNRIVPSTLAETSVIPSGKNATSLTRWEWPRKLPTFR